MNDPWVHSSGETDGYCDACVEEDPEGVNDPDSVAAHEACDDHELPTGEPTNPTCYVCGHDIERALSGDKE